MYEIKQRRELSTRRLFYFLVLFSKYYGFVKKKHSSKKMLYLRKNQIALIEMTLETQRIHLISCSLIRNVGISQWSMIVKNVLEILAKKIRCSIITYRCPLSDKCCRQSISSVTSGIFIRNQLGKNGFFCDFFTTRKCCSDQMNRNRFDPILALRDWSCSTMENLRCLNFAVN